MTLSVYPYPVIDLYVLVVACLAVARLCVLMVDDKITECFRQAVRRRYGAEHLLTFGSVCPWCWSIWFAFPVTLVTYMTRHPLWLGLLTALAISYVASRLADR